jgi:hydrogenase expression/formation protein HypE
MQQASSTMNERHIGLAHGNGGRLMRELITQIFAAQLGAESLDTSADAALVGALQGPLFMTVDAFAVQPLEFPGGDIGSLAVHGTINDLAVAGALPRHLTLSAILEEGLEVEVLERIVASLAQAAKTAGVSVVAGDTKVVPRGHGGGIYLSVSGVGVKDPGLELGMRHISDGDRIVVSGQVGDHGTAVLLAREEFGLSGEIRSDCASVLELVQAISGIEGIHFLRDPTRGGLATVAHEVALATGLQIRLEESAIPVHESVHALCEILGYDPLYLACEGRVVAFVSAAAAESVLHTWQQRPSGANAAIIGSVERGNAGVLLQTPIGGLRVLEELEDDPLPRIC